MKIKGMASVAQSSAALRAIPLADFSASSYPLPDDPSCLKVGVQGSGGDQKSLRLCPRSVQASASVPGVSDLTWTPDGRDPCNCRLFRAYESQKRQQSQGWGRLELSLHGVPVLATVVAFGFGSSSRMSKASTITVMRRVGVAWGCDPCNCCRFWALVFLSAVKNANCHRDGGVSL